MEEHSNNLRGIYISVVLAFLAYIIAIVFGLDFDTGSEIWMAILFGILYFLSGILFLAPKKRTLSSLLIFFIYFIIVSFLLSISVDSAIILLFFNPTGLVIMSYFTVAEIIPYPFFLRHDLIEGTVAGIFPPLLMYAGAKVKYFLYMNKMGSTEKK